MRYDSMPNSEKQPNDSQRGWSNSCLYITLVLLFLPTSKMCPSNWVSQSVTSWSRSGHHISFERGDLELSWDIKVQKFSDGWVWFKPGTNSPISAWLWSALGSNSIPLYFGLSLCNLLEHIELPYPRWKGTSIAFIWGKEEWSSTWGYRDMDRLTV